MSEFSEKHSIARLIGAPPGYVGYDEGGYLTEAVRRRPYSVILLDEVEKAHREIFNVLLQVLDDGRMTDGQGRTVNFKNTLVIMTSNIGSDLLLKENPDDASTRGAIMKRLSQEFRPEFLNRIDETVLFHRLQQVHLRKIVDIQLKVFEARLAKQNVRLEVTDEAKDLLGLLGYDPVYGARPLKRALRQHLQNLLARQLLSGEVAPHDTVKVIAAGETLEIQVISNKQQDAA